MEISADVAVFVIFATLAVIAIILIQAGAITTRAVVVHNVRGFSETKAIFPFLSHATFFLFILLPMLFGLIYVMATAKIKEDKPPPPVRIVALAFENSIGPKDVRAVNLATKGSVDNVMVIDLNQDRDLTNVLELARNMGFRGALTSFDGGKNGWPATLAAVLAHKPPDNFLLLTDCVKKAKKHGLAGVSFFRPETGYSGRHVKTVRDRLERGFDKEALVLSEKSKAIVNRWETEAENEKSGG